MFLHHCLKLRNLIYKDNNCIKTEDSCCGHIIIHDDEDNDDNEIDNDDDDEGDGNYDYSLLLYVFVGENWHVFQCTSISFGCVYASL